MKTEDNYFRGFPTLWNAAAFYLFLLKPQPWLAAASVSALAVLTFVPFKFVHPFRVDQAARRQYRGGAGLGGLGVRCRASDLDPARG
jgi:phosphatidylcholine synthase